MDQFSTSWASFGLMRVIRSESIMQEVALTRLGEVLLVDQGQVHSIYQSPHRFSVLFLNSDLCHSLDRYPGQGMDAAVDGWHNRSGQFDALDPVSKRIEQASHLKPG